MDKLLWKAMFAASFGMLCTGTGAEAAKGKYQVTEAEQAACGPDVISLCGNVGEDEDKVLACMKANRTSLTATCRPVFEEGLRRRGLR